MKTHNSQPSTEIEDELDNALSMLKLDNQKSIQQRLNFLGLDQNQVDTIVSNSDKIYQVTDDIIDRMYEKFLANPTTSKFLPTQQIVNRLKSIQKEYFRQLLSGEYDQQYIRERVRIGLTHVNVELEPQWYLGAYNHYLSDVTEVIFSELMKSRWILFFPRKKIEQNVKSLTAVCKIVFFDMSLAIDAYIGKMLNDINKQRQNMLDNVAEISANLEEMCATLTELSSTVNQNLDNARQTGIIANETATEKQSLATSQVSDTIDRLACITRKTAEKYA